MGQPLALYRKHWSGTRLAEDLMRNGYNIRDIPDILRDWYKWMAERKSNQQKPCE